MAQPKALAVIHQDLHGGGAPIAKDEDPAAERVTLQYRLAELRQAVNALAEISRLDGHQDAHLRRDLNHAPPARKLLVNATRSGAVTPLISILIRAPDGSSTGVSGMTAETARKSLDRSDLALAWL
jgi:hypothetical protein